MSVSALNPLSPFAALAGVSVTGAGNAGALQHFSPSFTVVLSGAGLVASYGMNLEGSQDNSNWFQIGAAMTTAGAFYFTGVSPALFARLNLTAISIATSTTGSLSGTITGP